MSFHPGEAEPHKIPATTLSPEPSVLTLDGSKREKAIMDRLTYILDENDITYSEDAVLTIANITEGGITGCLEYAGPSLGLLWQMSWRKRLPHANYWQHHPVAHWITLRRSATSRPKRDSRFYKPSWEGKDANRFVEDGIMMTRHRSYTSLTSWKVIMKLTKIKSLPAS